LVIVARIAGTGQTVEAHRDLEPGNFECPACGGKLRFKRGRTVVSHFAHGPDSDCPASEGESQSHLRAKLALAYAFRANGLSVELERAHLDHGRRVDIAVAVPAAGGGYASIAVEVQNSPITVPEIKRREFVDRRLGYFATVWVFTLDRLPRLIRVLPGDTLRIPDEMRYLVSRWEHPLNFIDTKNNRMLHVSTERAYAETTSYYDSSGDLQEGGGQRLKQTRHVSVTEATYVLAQAAGQARFGGITAVFAPAQRTDEPWAAMYTFSSMLLPRVKAGGFQPASILDQTGSSWLIAGDTHREVLALMRTLSNSFQDVFDHLEVWLFHLHTGRAWQCRHQHGYITWELKSEHS
jgi:hypothetical protein